MHIYPWIVVRAFDREAAYSFAKTEVERMFEEVADCPYDYGGVVDLDDGITLEQAVLSSDDPDWANTMQASLGVEKRVQQEHWDVLQSAMRHLQDREQPPTDMELIPVHYRLGCGIAGILASGHECEHKLPFDLVLYHARQLQLLRQHWECGRSRFVTAEAMIYDLRVTIPSGIALDEHKAGDNIYAVRADFHF